ncbi:MAG TPA: 50S ribosomal protein L24 [Candidatus Acidoferrum sp.]|nr:50S ribosomal protein L24 [Candidatus Acidoferrum sp.]
MQSSKPRSQRYFRFNAPMHVRQHFVHAHLDKSLRDKMPVKRRAIQLVKGDTVKVMSGSKRGTSGKVISVSLRTGKILIDSLKRKNAKGKELNTPISSSNVYITDLNLSDKIRAAALKMKAQPKEKEEQKPKAEAKAPEEKKSEVK